jgi:hypothetical protein
MHIYVSPRLKRAIEEVDTSGHSRLISVMLLEKKGYTVLQEDFVVETQSH